MNDNHHYVVHTIVASNDDNELDDTNNSHNNNTQSYLTSPPLPPPSTTFESTKQPNSKPTKANGATSLLEKYATLNNAINNTRHQITNLSSQITTITTQINALQSQNKSITTDIQTQIETTIPSIKGDVRSIQKEYNDLVNEYKTSNCNLDYIKTSLKSLQEKKEYDRKEFLRSCHDFRIGIRRNRVCLDGLLQLTTKTTSTTTTTTSNSTKIASSLIDDQLSTTSYFEREDYEINITNIDDDDDDDVDDTTGNNVAFHNDRSDDDDNNHDDEEDNMTISTNASTLSNSILTSPNANADGSSTTTTRNATIQGNKRSTCTVSPVPNNTTLLSNNKRRRIHHHHLQRHINPRDRQGRHNHDEIDEMISSSNEYINDKEIKQAKQIMNNTSNISTQTKQNLDRIKYEKKILADRATSRSRQLEQQRSQLDKVRVDVQEMERRIASLEENTVECRQISDGYAKDAERRRKTLSASYTTPVGQNSYDSNRGITTPSYSSTSNIMNHSSTSSFSNQNNYNSTMYSSCSNESSSSTTNNDHYHRIKSSGPRPTTIQNPYAKKVTKPVSQKTPTQMKDSYRNALAKQHPHRAGRIRVCKQFSTALSVSTNLEDDDDDDVSDEEGSKVNRNLRDECRSVSSKGMEHQGKGSTNDRCDVSVEDSVTSKRSAHVNISDDDDEDDDALLLYIPFDKDK